MFLKCKLHKYDNSFLLIPSLLSRHSNLNVLWCFLPVISRVIWVGERCFLWGRPRKLTGLVQLIGTQLDELLAEANQWVMVKVIRILSWPTSPILKAVEGLGTIWGNGLLKIIWFRKQIVLSLFEPKLQLKNLKNLRISALASKKGQSKT